MDYTARYGLEFNPFIKNTKDILVDTAESAEVRVWLGTLEKIHGFDILTGDSRRGKATCVRTWAAPLSPSLYKVCYSSLSNLTIMEFYRRNAMLLGADPGFRKSDTLTTSRGKSGGTRWKNGAPRSSSLMRRTGLPSKCFRTSRSYSTLTWTPGTWPWFSWLASPG